MERLFLLKYKAKETIAEVALLALGVMFQDLSRTCPELKKELADWNDGRTFALGILPHGPGVTFQYTGGRIKYLGKGIKNPDVTIYFKNIDSALLVFTGQMGAHTASIQNRTVIHGDLGQTMQTVRAMDFVIAYLMPGFMHKNLFKRRPHLSMNRQLLKAGLLAALPAGLLLNAAR